MPPAQGAAQPQQKRRRRRRRPGDEEEPVLRTTCDACTSAKVKCNGEKPCMRCGNKNIQCEYTFKKRCGPKRRKNVPGDNGGLLAPYPAGAKLLGFDDHLRGESTALNKDEVECVDVFMQNINSFLPLTTMDAVKRAATATAPYGGDARGTDGSGDDDGCGGGGDTQDEERNQVHHARKAMLHGAIALGAQLLDKDEASLPHSSIAREEIKECFDAALPELVAAHLILALYWTLQMDSTKITRCIGLAHQSKGIIGDPPGALAASLTFVSVMLYDAKVVSSIGCRVEPPGSANKAGIPSAKNPAACQERVLNILSFVLLAIHNHSFGSGSSAAAAAAVSAGGLGSSTGEWDPKALTEHVYEAKALLDEGAVGGGPNDISRCIVVVLQAYFLLLTDSRRQAIVITEPLADLVADNPLVLHLPIVWSMVGCVRVLLDQANRTIAVERLQSAMEPLAAHLGFSTDASLVEQELMRVFAWKPTGVAKRRGATTALSAAGAAAAAAAATAASAAAAATVEAEDLPVSADVLMRHSRAQTSSLNVTAQDYSHRGRSPMDMLALEPSPAPRRRALPQSTARNQGASRGGGGGGGVSPSLLSAAMVSSGEPLLASSPPPSRAGALTRAPATRGSLLSVSAPFAQVKSPPALPLEIPFIGGGFPDEAFAGAGDGTVMSNRVKEEQQMVVRAEAGGGSTGDREGEALLPAGDGGGGGGGDKEMEGDRPQLMRRQRAQQASFTPDAPVLALEGMAAELEDEEDEDGRQQSFKADAPLPQEDGVKLEGDRRELMAKQQVQQSFVADAPVSLEQVESNMARLGVSHLSSSQGEDASGLSRLVTSMDLDAAAELLATRQTNFIS